MSEADVQRAVLDWLSVKGVLAFRMNVGVARYGKSYVKYGTPGMADVLAFPMMRSGFVSDEQWTMPTWIELKAAKGVQSDYQKSFQLQVECVGHAYILVRSIEELEAKIIL